MPGGPSSESAIVETHWEDGLPIVRIVGVLDESGTEALAAELEHVCTIRGDVAVDVARMAAADMTGLAPVVATARSLRGRGARLHVRGASVAVYRILEMLDPTAAVAVETPTPGRSSH